MPNYGAGGTIVAVLGLTGNRSSPLRVNFLRHIKMHGCSIYIYIQQQKLQLTKRARS